MKADEVTGVNIQVEQSAFPELWFMALECEKPLRVIRGRNKKQNHAQHFPPADPIDSRLHHHTRQGCKETWGEGGTRISIYIYQPEENVTAEM